MGGVTMCLAQLELELRKIGVVPPQKPKVKPAQQEPTGKWYRDGDIDF